MKIAFPSWRLLPLSGCLALAGCLSLGPAPETTRYFLLDSGADAPASAGEVEVIEVASRLGIRQVLLSSYLHSRRMVVHDGSNEVVYSRFDLWAEALEVAVARTLAEALEEDLGYPVPIPPLSSYAGSFDRTLTVSVVDMAGYADGTVKLVAMWSLSTSDTADAQRRRATFSDRWTPGDFDSLVAAHSRNVRALATAIAESLEP